MAKRGVVQAVAAPIGPEAFVWDAEGRASYPLSPYVTSDRIELWCQTGRSPFYRTTPARMQAYLLAHQLLHTSLLGRKEIALTVGMNLTILNAFLERYDRYLEHGL